MWIFARANNPYKKIRTERKSGLYFSIFKVMSIISITFNSAVCKYLAKIFKIALQFKRGFAIIKIQLNIKGDDKGQRPLG